MTRFKDFDAARAERAKDPIEFKLAGEMFSAVGDMPAGLLLDASAAMAGTSVDQAAMFQALFEGIVAPEDHERFAAAVRRVDMETVLDVVNWIMEEVTGRPLTSASSSEAPPPQDGQPSRVVSLSPVTEARSA